MVGGRVGKGVLIHSSELLIAKPLVLCFVCFTSIIMLSDDLNSFGKSNVQSCMFNVIVKLKLGLGNLIVPFL